ncbi:hypothetical protein ARMSODRAFT_165477 [Armillaria solidipes]|uniref:Uncharacterized protein n=1 Tax=Armillaria solidipes TaxID=1076256 RepID=A0A2H3BF36_9AGAR|nr:hypothetical protein ARMSODRAFT_165477 [Armillaria solidipes]
MHQPLFTVLCTLIRYMSPIPSSVCSPRRRRPGVVPSPSQRHPSTSLVGYQCPFSRRQEADANKSAISQHKGPTPRAYPTSSSSSDSIIIHCRILSTGNG